MFKGNNRIGVTEIFSIQTYSALTDNEPGRNDFAPKTRHNNICTIFFKAVLRLRTFTCFNTKKHWSRDELNERRSLFLYRGVERLNVD